MLGRVKKINDNNETGYIEGFDETTYFFHLSHVKNNVKLNLEDIVEFDYLENKESLPYAVNIEKCRIL